MAKTQFEKIIKSLSEIGAFSSKIGIFLGAICIVSYSLRINHFPQDLAIGDGLLFLMAAMCFGIIYAFFIVCLVALGVVMSPIIRLIFFIVGKVINFARKRKLRQHYELAAFDTWAILPSIFSVVLILIFGQRDRNAYWNLPLLSAALYLFYSLFISSGKKIKKIETIKNSILLSSEKNNVFTHGDPDKLKQMQQICVGVTFICPLFIGGVSGQLLDAAMRAAHVRNENVVIYVMEPYASLIPNSVASEFPLQLKDYKSFDKAFVLLSGFGKTTVISFKDRGIERKLEIPNDKMIIESK